MLRKLENWVAKNEMGDPTVGKIGEVGKLVKKVETGDIKVEELVKRIQMNDPKVGKVWEIDKIRSRGMHET